LTGYAEIEEESMGLCIEKYGYFAVKGLKYFSKPGTVLHYAIVGF
jgi:hypothetical protein